MASPRQGEASPIRPCTYTRIANGKIVEHRAVRDDLRFMMQLGLVGPASPQYAPVFEAWNEFMR